MKMVMKMKMWTFSSLVPLVLIGMAAAPASSQASAEAVSKLCAPGELKRLGYLDPKSINTSAIFTVMVCLNKYPDRYTGSEDLSRWVIAINGSSSGPFNINRFMEGVVAIEKNEKAVSEDKFKLLDSLVESTNEGVRLNERTIRKAFEAGSAR
jgi:hypothetical protein